MKKLLLFILLGLLLGLLPTVFVYATAVPKITWCHCEPSGSCQTLELPSAALQSAGHMSASGNPLHAGDHAGQCVEPTPTLTPTPTPIVEQTPTPIVTETPTRCVGSCGSPPTFAGSSTNAPQCDRADVKAADNVHVYRKGDSAIVKWWNTAGDKVHIYYKQVSSPDWQYSVIADNTGSFEIHGLGTMDISFAVQQVSGCGGGVSVISKTIIDGNASQWVLFR